MNLRITFNDHHKFILTEHSMTYKHVQTLTPIQNPVTFFFKLRRANLPTFAEISASVLADEAWISRERESMDLIRELVSADQSQACI